MTNLLTLPGSQPNGRVNSTFVFLCIITIMLMILTGLKSIANAQSPFGTRSQPGNISHIQAETQEALGSGLDDRRTHHTII